MTVKIAILSHSDQFTDLALELSGEVEDTEILVQKTTSEKAQQDAIKMESEGVEAILARGEPAEAIKKIAKVPLINCRLTMLDLTRNLRDIGRNKQCLISGHMFFYPTFKEICREIEKLLNLKLHIFYYDSVEDLQEILNDVKQEKVAVDIVLGGHIVYAESRAIGVNSKELLFSKQTMLEIIHSARKVVKERRKIEEESKWVKSVIDFTKQGIVAIDSNGNINNLNKKAQLLLNPNNKSEQFISEPILKYLPDLKLIVKKGVSSQENIIQSSNQKIILDYQPLHIQDEYIGALISLENIHNIQKLEHKIRKTLSDKGLVAKSTLKNIIGSSTLIRRTIREAETFAKTDFNILISGETGTGKELFAQGIHLCSSLCRGPFVAINCAALPNNLLESELFGYEEGAFSGARKGGKIGLFELAHHGTIFLDEINSIDLAIQARLLRAIEEKEIMRIGGDRIVPIDVRVIAATNIELNVADGELRRDLYYRINELNLTTPPLRIRKEDIPELVHYFIEEYETKYKTVEGSTEFFINELINSNLSDYHWPGNVRELSNLVKRCIVLLDTLEKPEQLQKYFSEQNFCEGQKSVDLISVKQSNLAEMEKELINNMYQKYGYNKSELANILNISRSTLWRILKN